MDSFKLNGLLKWRAKYPAYWSAFSLVFISGINVLFQFLNFSLLSINLSVQDFGSYRTFLSIISFSGFFHAGYGDGLITKWVVNKINPEINNISAITLISILLCIPLIFYPKSPTAFVYILLFILANNFLLLAGGMFLRLQIYAAPSLYLFASQLFLFTVLMYKREDVSINLLVACTLAFALIFSILAFYYLQKKGVLVARGRALMPNLTELKTDIKTGVPILLMGLFFISIFNLDKVLLPLFVEKKVFGSYAFASSIVTVLFGVIAAPVNLIFSKMAYGERGQATKLYNKVYFVVFGCCSVLIICNPILEYLINIWLPKYIGSTRFLRAFSCLLFPVLILQLLAANFYRKNKKALIFLKSASVVFVLICIYFVVACYFNFSVISYPVALAQLLLGFVIYNEWKTAALFTELSDSFLKYRIGAAFALNVVLYLIVLMRN